MESGKEPEFLLILVRASNEPAINSEGYQAELKAFTDLLRNHGIPVSARMRMMESAGGGGFNLGEFWIAVKDIAPPLITGISGYLAGRINRRVKVTIDKLSLEASSVKEVEELLRVVKQYQKKAERK